MLRFRYKQQFKLCGVVSDCFIEARNSWLINDFKGELIVKMSKNNNDAHYFFVRGFLFCVYIIQSLCLALRVRNCVRNNTDKHQLAIVIAECFVGMTLPISLFHAWEHLTNFVRPRLQSQIVRIIFMVPVYSVESFLSIVYMKNAFYFQAVREIYESYVIYCFMRWMKEEILTTYMLAYTYLGCLNPFNIQSYKFAINRKMYTI